MKSTVNDEGMGKLAAAMRAVLPALALAPKRALPDDPWEFVRDCCWTFDELALASGLEARRRFPDKEYLRRLCGSWRAERAWRVEKSRQILVTWLMAALWLWWVLKHPGQRVAWICKEHNSAADHLRSRIFYMYQNIPMCWTKPAARLVGDEFLVFHDAGSRLATSRIVPIASEQGEHSAAATKLRSFTFSGIVWDEAAFQKNQREVYAAGLPCIGAGGKFNMVSSANGKEFFWRTGHGSIEEEAVVAKFEGTLGREELMRGMWGWKHNDFYNVRVHYSADPEKDPLTERGAAWFEAVRHRFPTRQWEREFEINFTVPAGLPVYGDTERIVQRRQSWRPWLKVFSGLDFGFVHEYAVLLQIVPYVEETKATPNAQRGLRELTVDVTAPKGARVVHRVHFLKEVDGRNMTIQHFGEKLLVPVLRKYFPEADVEHHADPAGNQRRPEGTMTCAQTLAALGIRVITRAVEVETRIEVMQALVSDGAVEIDPEGCPVLLAALLGGYHRDDDGEPVKDGEYDHSADAAGYVIWNLFGMENATAGTDGFRPHTAAPRGPGRQARRSIVAGETSAEVFRPGTLRTMKGARDV